MKSLCRRYAACQRFTFSQGVSPGFKSECKTAPEGRHKRFFVQSRTNELMRRAGNVSGCEGQSQTVRKIGQLVVVYERIHTVFRNVKLEHDAAAGRNPISLHAGNNSLPVVNPIQDCSDGMRGCDARTDIHTIHAYKVTGI